MPVVTKLDDSVKAGETFAIYGEGFDENSKVYALPITSSTITEFSSVDELSMAATECTVNKESSSKDILVADLDVANSGSYNIYVTNNYGISYARGLNTARPQWISDKEISAGSEFNIYGRNLSAYDFGGETLSGVAFLNDNGDSYNIPIAEVNPFKIKCVLDSVPTGTYTVYVTNDGHIWNEVEDGRKITVVNAPYDPFDIGTSLASKYNFRNVVDVAEIPYSIISGTDVTDELQYAIDTLSTLGGGVVYLPEGEYYISSLILKEGVVLAGDGIGRTTLIKVNSESDILISSNGNNKTGITKMSIKVPENTNLPSFGIVLGKQFDKKPTNQRVTEFGFLKSVSYESPMTVVNGAGSGICIGGKGDFLIEDCIFKGYDATISNSYVNEYVKIRNNSFETVVGNLYTVGEYADISENVILRRPKNANTAKNTQGIFMRGFSYVADNKIYNLGNKFNEATGNHDGISNDGEIICTEPYMGGTKLHGTIVEATENTVIVNVETQSPDWNLDSVYYAKAYLCITDGRGIGQYSRIESYDEITNSITLENGFEILPDSTSKFIVATLCESVTIYNNYCENAEKGYWLYGDNIDAVVVKNKGVNTEGIYVRGIYLDKVTAGADGESVYDNRQQIAYFISVCDNDFTGGSTVSGVCGIGVGMNVESSDPSMTYIYGVNIEGNSITKEVPEQEYIYAHEAPHINGIYVIYNTRVPQNNICTVIRGVIIQDNIINNSDRGITIGPFGYPNYNMTSYTTGDMTDNIHISENRFNNVEETLIDERNYSYN